ncbi:biotin--[acetyl-CoA-carboxylase] ligase [bacterium]|nr:biotin--[acetyl-CoA-carboxylase] ligase [bacterium]
MPIDENIRSFVRTRVHFEQLGSTNDEALRLAREGSAEGTFVTADEQVRGRGQRQRTWLSLPGKGLYYSIILRPELPVDRVQLLTLMAGIALCDTIRFCFRLTAELKWPNDVLIKDKKVAGILTECSWTASHLDYVVIGIGLNLEYQMNDFPSQLVFPATSVNLETNLRVEKEKLIETLTDCIEYWYGRLSEKGPSDLIDQWLERSTLVGRRVEIEFQDRNFIGIVRGLDTSGSLQIETEQVGLRSFYSGTVRFV